jgi:hypothetical protein
MNVNFHVQILLYMLQRKKEFKFAKLTDSSKARQEAIAGNKYRLPVDYKEAN